MVNPPINCINRALQNKTFFNADHFVTWEGGGGGGLNCVSGSPFIIFIIWVSVVAVTMVILATKLNPYRHISIHEQKKAVFFITQFFYFAGHIDNVKNPHKANIIIRFWPLYG